MKKIKEVRYGTLAELVVGAVNHITAGDKFVNAIEAAGQYILLLEDQTVEPVVDIAEPVKVEVVSEAKPKKGVKR